MRITRSGGMGPGRGHLLSGLGPGDDNRARGGHQTLLNVGGPVRRGPGLPEAPPGGKPQRPPKITLAPAVLRWARETRGYSLEDAAGRLRIPEGRLANIESGTEGLTIPYIEKFAQLYKRNVATLLMKEPPKEPSPPPDFRTVGSQGVTQKLSPELLLAIRKARRTQMVALELASRLGESAAFRMTSINSEGNRDHVASQISNQLTVGRGITRTGDDRQSLRSWIGLVENANVLVLQFPAKVEEARGFGLPSDKFPVIAINRRDAVVAREFTLIHELVHLLLGSVGICGPYRPPSEGEQPQQEVEQFCNDVAGRVLVPTVELKGRLGSTRLRTQDAQELDRSAILLSRYFHVSKAVILRRLLSEGLISRDQYTSLNPFNDVQAGQAVSHTGGGGADAVALRFNEYGRKYVRMILEADSEGLINPTDFSDYLELRLSSRDRLAQLALREGVE